MKTKDVTGDILTRLTYRHKTIIEDESTASKILINTLSASISKCLRSDCGILFSGGVDSTLIQHNGTWWMFTTDRDVNTSYNLNLFYSDSLFDDWKPHPQNPIKTDVRSARSAGTPFVRNGELFRPSMDYSKKIEGSITINKVVNITKQQYHEITQNEVGPAKNTFFSDKIHTLAEANGLTVIDGCKEAFIFTNVNFIKYKMKIIFEKLKS